MRTPIALLSLLLSLPAGADEGWSRLETLREGLAEDGPLVAEFRQSFVPAGFEDGDSESGRVALSLPDCLRWDYVEPYRKSFLVCGDRAWSWVEGEPRGHRFTIDLERELGLDLLLLSSDELSRRYASSLFLLSNGSTEIALRPLSGGAAGLAAANLVIDSGGRRPRSLEWSDPEGSVTTFLFLEWSRLEAGELFAPPPELSWSDPVDADPVR